VLVEVLAGGTALPKAGKTPAALATGASAGTLAGGEDTNVVGRGGTNCGAALFGGDKEVSTGAFTVLGSTGMADMPREVSAALAEHSSVSSASFSSFWPFLPPFFFFFLQGRLRPSSGGGRARTR